MKIKYFQLTIRHIQEIEPGEFILAGESLGSASYRFLKMFGWRVEEISRDEFIKSGGKID